MGHRVLDAVEIIAGNERRAVGGARDPGLLQVQVDQRNRRQIRAPIRGDFEVLPHVVGAVAQCRPPGHMDTGRGLFELSRQGDARQTFRSPCGISAAADRHATQLTEQLELGGADRCPVPGLEREQPTLERLGLVHESIFQLRELETVACRAQHEVQDLIGQRGFTLPDATLRRLRIEREPGTR